MTNGRSAVFFSRILSLPLLRARRVPSQSVTGYPLNPDNGKIHQFNVTIEQQFHDIGFRLSYVGSRNLRDELCDRRQ